MYPYQDLTAPISFPLVQRIAPRLFVRTPAWVTLDGHNTEHVAFVRDISTRGLFLYSDFCPIAGENIALVLEYLKGSNRVRLHLKGKVVRLEQTPPGSAVGVAIRFDSPQAHLPRTAVRVA